MINKNKTIDNNTLPKKWFIVDAENIVLGRLSSFLAIRLMGKHKTSYSDNNLCEDKIVVINAKKVVLTGKNILCSVFNLLKIDPNLPVPPVTKILFFIINNQILI